MDEDTQMVEASATDHIALLTGIVSAYVANNSVPVADLPALISGMHAALAGLAQSGPPAAPATEKLTPTQIRKSISHEALVSFEDGKSYKTLKRHLTLRGLTPEAYREKWGLPKDYPIVAAAYSEQRSKLAHALGLGQPRRKPVPAPEPEPAPAPVQVAETAAEKPKRAGWPRKVDAA